MSFEGTFQSDNWHREAPSITVRNNVRTRRWGMRVTVYLGVNAGDYVLSYGLNSTDLQDNANWLKVADIGQLWGGTSGITTASNGLYVDGTTVKLGNNPLVEETTIDGDLFDLTITNIEELTFESELTTINASNGLNISAGEIYMDSLLGIEITAVTGFNVTADSMALTADTSIDFLTPGTFTVDGDGTGSSAFTNQVNFTIQTSNNVGIEAAQTITVQANKLNLYSNTDIDLNAGPTNAIDLDADHLELNGIASSSPSTQYLRGDMTWAVPVGASYTSNNAITLTATNFQLGGAFTKNTTHDGNGFHWTVGANSNRLGNLRTWSNVVALDASTSLTNQVGSSTMTLNTTTASMAGATVILNASTAINFITSTIQLNSVAPSTPSTQFLRGDMTWAVPAGGTSVNFGTVAQIPYMNATNNNFNYESGFEYDQAADRLTVTNIRLGSSGLAGNRILDFQSSTGGGSMFVGNNSGNLGTVTFINNSSDVQVHSGLAVYNSAAHSTISGYIGISTAFGSIVNGVFPGSSAPNIFPYTNIGNGTGVPLIVRGGAVTASTGNSATTGDLLLSSGVSANATNNGDVTSGNVLINVAAPFNAGTYGNVSFFNATYATAPNFQAGEKIIYIGNRVTAPTGNPSLGGYLYVEAGALMFRGSAGTVTTVAPA